MANHSQPFYHLNLCLIGYVRIFVRLRPLPDLQTHFERFRQNDAQILLEIFMIQSAG